MPIETIPKIYINNDKESPDLFFYDLKTSQDIIKSKVDLTMNMFSFLQVEKKTSILCRYFCRSKRTTILNS